MNLPVWTMRSLINMINIFLLKKTSMLRKGIDSSVFALIMRAGKIDMLEKGNRRIEIHGQRRRNGKCRETQELDAK